MANQTGHRACLKIAQHIMGMLQPAGKAVTGQKWTAMHAACIQGRGEKQQHHAVSVFL